jgi:NADH-quinone oxidoreductase subunit G
LKSLNSLDILDSFHSNIRFDIRGSNILRVLPKINDNLNEE